VTELAASVARSITVNATKTRGGYITTTTTTTIIIIIIVKDVV
jgi:hypothetical protein